MTTVTPSETMGQAPVAPTQPDKQTDNGMGQAPQAPEAKAPVEDTLSPKFAALARKEKALRAEMRAFQAEREAVKAQQSEIEKAKTWQSKLTQDPWTVLMEAGLSPEKATEILLNQPKPEDLKFTQLQSQIQALNAQREKDLKDQQDAEQRRYEQAKKQIGNDVKVLVDSDQNFETIKTMQAEDAVVELIEQHFHQTGSVMSVEQACKEVEDYLLEEALKISQLSKVKSKLAPPPVPPEASKTETPQKTPIQTLTNRAVQASSKPLTEKDRRERAIAAFRGQKIS